MQCLDLKISGENTGVFSVLVERAKQTAFRLYLNTMNNRNSSNTNNVCS